MQLFVQIVSNLFFFSQSILRNLQNMNIVIPDVNRDSAVGAAAVLIWNNLIRVATDRETPARRLSEAIKPVYGIAWNRAVIKLVKKGSYE